MPQGNPLGVIAPSFHGCPSSYGWAMSFRKLILIAAAIGIAIAFRNAVADKGGTYDPATNA